MGRALITTQLLDQIILIPVGVDLNNISVGAYPCGAPRSRVTK